MAYIDSINNDSTDYAINSFANLLTASGSASDAKTVTFPNGYDVTEGSTMTFRVLFPNGHTGQLREIFTWKNERKEVVTETPIVEESKKRFLKINNYL